MGAENVYEAATTRATFAVDGEPIPPPPGNRDLPDGILFVSYPLAKQGKKTVRFEADRITVEVDHPGEFSECLPLLKRAADRIEVADNRVVLHRGKSDLAVVFDPSQGKPVVTETDTAVGAKRLVTVVLNAADRLSYALSVR